MYYKNYLYSVLRRVQRGRAECAYDWVYVRVHVAREFTTSL